MQAEGCYDAYDALDATAMAQKVASGELGAAELLEQALERADRLNPALNAIVLDHRDRAREAARGGPQGPLAGVPFLLKDLGIQMAGTVTTEGSRFFADAVAQEDSFVVERYRKAGLVIFGKTASPEFGRGPVTESLLFGDCRNPWDLTRTPGGSSGGAAAAVAAGIVPAAQGSDGGGSLRIPASACGLFGFKPSRFRVPLGPGKGDGGGMSTIHAISRSVRDSALLLDIAQGPEPGGYAALGAPERPFAEEAACEPGQLRIGLVSRALFDYPVDPACRAAVEGAARLCESLGHAVEAVDLPVDGARMMTAGGLVFAAGAALAVRRREEALGRPAGEGDLEPRTLAAIAEFRRASAEALAEARAHQVRVHRAMADLMERFDVLLSPTMAVPPGPIGSLGPEVDEEAFNALATGYGVFTMLYNFTGQPAMSVPLHWTDEGLPIGVQFAGRFGEEALLFRLAGQLERAAPWFGRRPPRR